MTGCATNRLTELRPFASTSIEFKKLINTKTKLVFSLLLYLKLTQIIFNADQKSQKLAKIKRKIIKNFTYYGVSIVEKVIHEL